MKVEQSGEISDFAFLYNNAACGLISFDLSGKVHKMNNSLLNWTGLEVSQVDKLFFPELLEKGSQLYYQLFVYPLLQMHKEVKEISLQMETKNESFQCFLSAKVITGSGQNNNTLVHAAIFKVVDRKKFEDELRLRKNNAELEILKKEETLKKVASDQSHLVRAPLANILGLIALLEQTGMTSDSKELLCMMKESANQLDTVIRNIVDTANN